MFDMTICITYLVFETYTQCPQYNLRLMKLFLYIYSLHWLPNYRNQLPKRYSLQLIFASYHSATMPVALVPVEYTLVTCTGKNVPPFTPTKVTVSPPTVSTVKSPYPPIYSTHPLLVPPVTDGMSVVFDGVTAAARPACNFMYIILQI